MLSQFLTQRLRLRTRIFSQGVGAPVQCALRLFRRTHRVFMTPSDWLASPTLKCDIVRRRQRASNSQGSTAPQQLQQQQQQQHSSPDHERILSFGSPKTRINWHVIYAVFAILHITCGSIQIGPTISQYVHFGSWVRIKSSAVAKKPRDALYYLEMSFGHCRFTNVHIAFIHFLLNCLLPFWPL